MAYARNLVFAIAALPALGFSAPTAAQVLPVGGALITKTEAIIGGQSRLAQILSQQGAPARAIVPQPASYGPQRIFLHSAVEEARPSPGVLNGRPDIFGSVALRVRHTPLDGRWQRVEHARVSGPAAAFASSLRGQTEASRVDAVNRYVNRQVRFVDDERQYGRADLWSTANATLKRGRGDCEDYAIAKIQMLRAAGLSDRDLYLVILKDLVRHSDHAVAVVRTGEHMYVLDNGTDRLLDSDVVSDYRPILTFAANGTWTHGYRVTSPPVTIASATAPPAESLASAADTGDQRSRSASLLAFNTGFNR